MNKLSSKRFAEDARGSVAAIANRYFHHIGKALFCQTFGQCVGSFGPSAAIGSRFACTGSNAATGEVTPL